MLVNLNKILPQANAEGRAIASFNTFGIEYATACIAAAEELQTPVILSINMDMMNYMPIEPYVALLLGLAEPASVPVCVHLDHCYEHEKVVRAMDAGVTSVMFDGSQLPLEENIEKTAWVVEKAKSYDITVEAELGSVPYASGRDHIVDKQTIPEEADVFCRQSGCHALAVSVGNVHRLVDTTVDIHYQVLAKIQQQVTVPLVIHGASGITMEDINRLALTTNIAKCNIGTALRTCWYGEVSAITAAGEANDTLGVMEKLLPKMQAQSTRYISAMMPQRLKEK